MIDCLIVGYNDLDFTRFVEKVRLQGESSAAYRDLKRYFVEHDGTPMRSMDVLNHFHQNSNGQAHFSNVDFLWPVVLYLGTYLHQRGFSFDYVNLFHVDKQKLKNTLLDENVRTVAITTTLYVMPDQIMEIISFIREHDDKVKIVVGGPYIHNQSKLLDEQSLLLSLKYMGADFYVVSAEGEATLAALLRALKSNDSPERVHNLIYRDGNRYTRTSCQAESNPLEENMVDYRLFSRDDIGQCVSIRTSKSCPFSCAFCGFPQRAGKYTYMSVELVEQELNTLNDLGVTMVTFLDDTFNVPLNRFHDLLRMMIRNKYDFKWNSFFRSDHRHDDTADLMQQSGCEGVFLGVESGSDKMLELMNKTSRQKHYKSAIEALQAAGISVHASLIVGYPGETEDTVSDSIGLIEDTRPDFFRAMLWYADPVTPIWQQRDEIRLKGRGFNWSHHTMDCQVACDLIDAIFLRIGNSHWLPQDGFEQWSTFYLQRKGMSMNRVKNFVNCFNSVVRDQLLDQRQKSIRPELMAPLKSSCQFPETENGATISSEVCEQHRTGSGGDRGF